MRLTGLDLLFWTAGFFGHVALLLVLWTRRRAATFPFFTAYITANVLRTMVLYVVLHEGTKSDYYYTFWTLDIIDTILQLAVVYEMAAYTFRPLGVWARDRRSRFVWLVASSIAIATGLTWLASPPTRLWMQVVVIKGNFFSAALMSELFIGMMALSGSAKLPWRTHVAKISQGLGVYSMVDVVIEAGHGYFGLGHDNHIYVTFSHVRMAVYLACLAYWIIMLWYDEPPGRELTAAMSAQLFTLQKEVEYDLERLRSRERP
jgi:hypothetical protein